MLVSVIIPVYNAAKWVERSIKSVLNQTYQNFEIIIIDDGSTDNSWSIINKYSSDKVRVYRSEKNCGMLATRNKGLELCKGDIVIFLDADDELTINALETVVRKFNELPEDVGILFAKIRRDDYSEEGLSLKNEGYVSFTQMVCGKYKDKHDLFVAFKRKFIGNLRYQTLVTESFFYSFVARSCKVYYVPVVLRLYHDVANPLSLSKKKRHAYYRLRIAKKIAYDLDVYLKEFGDHILRVCPKTYSDYNYYRGFYILLTGDRLSALKSFIKSLMSYPNKRTFFYILLSIILPTSLIRELFLRKYK
ncbi:MAG: glycosyltransferase family 2 protein [Nitrososphaerota archaeon]